MSRWNPRTLLALSSWVVVAGSASAQSWEEQSPTGAPPSARYSAGSAYDPASDRLILFGGEDAGGLPRPNDVWVLDRATGLGGAPTWLELLPTGTAPLGRWGGSTVYDPSTDRLIVHGGCAGNCSPALDDTWAVAGASGLGPPPAWESLPASPVARAEHVAAYDPVSHRMLVFGGHTAFFGTDRNDVWALVEGVAGGGAAWVELFPTGTPPAPRAGASGFYDAASDRLVLYGGATTTGTQYGDLWVLVGASGSRGAPAWVELSPTGGPPDARNAGVMVHDAQHNRAVLFGGFTGSYPDDVWVLTHANGLGGTPRWIELQPAGGMPAGRTRASAAYSQAANRLVVTMGRVDDQGNLVDDVWWLDGANGILGGDMAGFGPRRVICLNITTAQSLNAVVTDPIVDCRELGLVVVPGDRVSVRVIGRAE